MVPETPPVDSGKDTRWDGDQQGDQQADSREDQRSFKRRSELAGNRHTVFIRRAKVPGQRVAEPGTVLDEEGPIEAHFLSHVIDLLLRDEMA